MALGAFCLVLHGHLPWVFHHGRWPHGEDWLYEAASGTWLPLLEVLDTCRAEGLRPAWTLGLMPILLEQLRQPGFAERFDRWLEEGEHQAERDEREFESWGDGHRAWLARGHQERFRAQRDQLRELGGDLVGALAAHEAAGRLELMSSNATHGYHPLILHDACSRAQIRAGLATSERHLGRRPRGVWLPECAYRPPGPWHPPLLHDDPRDRAGVAGMYAEESVRFFFVDEHLVRGAHPEARLDGPRVEPVGERLPQDAWCSPLEPHRVVEAGALTELTVLARCGEVAQHVWNADSGYPGDGRYLEFHKRHGLRGLRYWRITDRQADLAAKEPYQPDWVRDALYAHGDHFTQLVRDRLADHGAGTGGRFGVVCAPFDAELFGHWWVEGPRFLLEIARRMHHHPDIELCTVSELLDRIPPDKAASLPEGSWGAHGDHSVWLRQETRQTWLAQYRAEDRFLDLWHRAPWETDPRARELLTEAGRQLLLLEASDWPFVISTGGAVDYGTSRVLEHAARFADLCNGVEDLLAGHETDPVTEAALAWCRSIDPVFPDLDLAWWS